MPKKPPKKSPQKTAKQAAQKGSLPTAQARPARHAPEADEGGPSTDKNANLSAAKKAKNDEFYTQWADIEREMNAYLEYDSNVFRDKVILLPCDDPEWSNFAKFFALHFMDYGLKRLISTSFAPDSKPQHINYQPTLFETSASHFDANRTRRHGKLFVLDREDVNGDGVVNIEDLKWSYLSGDGDFRSPEVTALRDQADIVITNPPFSLFREFVGWLLESEVRFSIIGSSNAPTTKDIFPYVRNSLLWKGATANNTDMVFAVPKGVPVREADRLKAARLGYESNKNHDYTRLGNSCWFTNIEHGRRHEPLVLMNMQDNLRHSRHAEITRGGYRRYDNYDAIDVPFTDAIPDDCMEMMGVPISFLDKHNPEQFEIVGITKTWFGAATKTYGPQVQVDADGTKTTVSKLNDGAAIRVAEAPIGKTYYMAEGALFIQSYPRILIKRRPPA